jgi:hypothetical protein
MPRDRVTICLYSTERDNGTFYDVCAKEKESIQRMSTQLAHQARLAGKEPPEMWCPYYSYLIGKRLEIAMIILSILK